MFVPTLHTFIDLHYIVTLTCKVLTFLGKLCYHIPMIFLAMGIQGKCTLLK